MTETAVFHAFLAGLVSACSLPLGTLTLLFWRPSNKAIALLIAFGAGALLAALTIDLVVPALDNGEYQLLAAGCICGSLLYLGLNDIINNRGGFLRKTATTFTYFERQSEKKFSRLVHSFRRMPVFQLIPDHEAHLLGTISRRQEYPGGAQLYRKGDTPANLYIVENGQVELLDPRQNMEPFLTLGPGDSFSRMAFITGLPNATAARTKGTTSVWIIEKESFSSILDETPVLRKQLAEFLSASPEIKRYLVQRHGMSPEESDRWIHAAATAVNGSGHLVCASSPQADRQQQAEDALRHASRFPVLEQLPPDLVKAVAGFMHHYRYDKGEVIYRNSEYADRLYLVTCGTVALIDPSDDSPDPHILTPGSIFGALSMLTGAHHAAAAVAQEDVGLWVIRRKDFDILVRTHQELAVRLERFLTTQTVRNYLEQRQHFHADIATQWTRKALEQLSRGNRPLPATEEMNAEIREHKNAPMAIWLGILLDGIPESLVIGALMVTSPMISLSLLAGLFLSNYPEALSSSAGMRQQGMSLWHVLLMWSSLMLMTGIGAALGNLMFNGAPPHLFAFTKGIAAGAMLTVIAETMLPEAYLKGGSVTGLTTLLGFLGAILAGEAAW
ncbi:MAG: cyclic nucleotide-binding domain-containing protein [Prosthecochloris sp.]|nr:cyclic nucleotide-binding domain-containing protein [Prosthecochloris sp.]